MLGPMHLSDKSSCVLNKGILLCLELYEPFIEANKKEDPVERMWALKCLVSWLLIYSSYLIQLVRPMSPLYGDQH